MRDERGRLTLKEDDAVYRIGSGAYFSLEKTSIVTKPANPHNLNIEKSVRRDLWVLVTASGVGFRPTWKVT